VPTLPLGFVPTLQVEKSTLHQLAMSRSGGVMFSQVPTVLEQVATEPEDESIGGDESAGDESPGGDESVGDDEASSPSTGMDPLREASGAESEPLDFAAQATSSKPRAP
jgi:hypothetical protein